MLRFAFLTIAFTFSTQLLPAADDAALQKKGPLRVYILAGQSNMLGKAKIAHLDELLADSNTAGDYQHIRKDGKWVERQDVWVNFFNRRGNLNGSYGDWRPNIHFGPELGFGHRVGAELDDQVLIIKTAWGGRSLGRNFRPPSSGLVENPGKADLHYAHMVWSVHQVLAKLPELFPDYEASRGYELSGFVWLQGWNDAINGGFRAEYEKNLINLAKDLRRDLGAAELPFIVGELGQGGPDDTSGPTTQMRTAQKNAVKAVGHAAYVPTSPYARPKAKHYDGGYHYFGRADTLLEIGDALAKAAIELTPAKATEHSKQVAAAQQAFQKTACYKQYSHPK